MTSKDTTFLGFTPEQAAAYAAGRGTSYPRPLYQAILDYHTGERDLFLDVGTGPGKVVFDLLPDFKRGIGCDTSPQMIEQARKDAHKHGQHIVDMTKFAVCGGEDCVKALSIEEVGQVDLITVAMAVHWFDLPNFYSSAARALKPGGTLAIWTCSSNFAHPNTRNHKRVQTILSDLEDGMLKPYITPGNILSRNGYEGLDLPWSIPETAGVFEESSFNRRDWDRGGVPSAPAQADGSPGKFLIEEKVTPEQLEAALNAASMVVRWRAANPDKAHTEEDAVKLTAKRLKEALGGNERFVASPSASLLLMRKA